MVNEQSNPIADQPRDQKVIEIKENLPVKLADNKEELSKPNEVPESAKQVPFFSLFRYATGRDKVTPIDTEFEREEKKTL